MGSKFAAAIKAGLVIKGVSQNKFADAVGVSANTVTSWVKDKHFPDKESLLEIQQFLDWSEEKITILLEDWFHNEHGEKNYRIAGSEFVNSKYNGDYEAFVSDVIELDETTIVGISREHEGTPQQWAPIFQSSPYTWRLLILGDEIVGYWQFVCLKDDYYRRILEGSLTDSEILIEMIDFPVVEGKYRGYFVSLTTRVQDRGPKTLSLLNCSLEKILSDFARNGIIFSEFCATAFSFEGRRMCELMGMKYQQRHPRANGAQLADIFRIKSDEISKSYWARNSFILKAYGE